MKDRKPTRAKPDPHEEKKRQEQLVRRTRLSIGYVITALVALWLFQEFMLAPVLMRATEIPYSEFKQKLAAGQIVEAVIGHDGIKGEMKSPKPGAGAAQAVPFATVFQAGGDPRLAEDLGKAGVKYTFRRPPSPVGGFGIGKSKATAVKPEEVGVTYKDVGGADEAIAELQEIIQFLKTPEQFARLGGRIPKGVLLVGPPGTGKTLLARATAGEAHVPFFETSGSEFVEMFVGVGAARVRDLFAQARDAAPAIAFIDEIDAIGQSRGGAIRIGTNDEREQTLNQLLAEIDGFTTDTGKPVIIMAATSRPEVLDPALMRAGRFDRQVAVGNPDLTGRAQILAIHSRGIKLASDFDLRRAARVTAGLSGADLANVMNEAALLAARRNAEAVTLDDFQAAIERVVAGLEKKSRVMNDQERRTVAYHEAGHALVAALIPHADPVSKISIVPRSRGALGFTMQMPTEDRYLLTTDELKDCVAVMLGGRAAESTVFGEVSTGASDDILRATELSRRMVTEFGMSEKLGSVRYAGQQFQYLGGAAENGAEIGAQTREMIDDEIRRIVTEQYERSQVLLKEHRAALETLAQQLLKQESVDGSAVAQALGMTPGSSARKEPAPIMVDNAAQLDRNSELRSA